MRIFKLVVALFLSFFFITVLAFSTPTINSNFELIESVPAQTIFGEFGVRRTKQVWLDMINTAKSSIDLGGFYISALPRSSMMAIIAAIEKAADRGVNVRIMIEASMQGQSKTAITALQDHKNIEIRFFPMHKIVGGILHAKYMVIDNADVYVGSQNFDWKALDQIHEIGVRIRDERLAQTIDHVFNIDWELCVSHSLLKQRKLLNAPVTFMPTTEKNPIKIDVNGEELTIHAAFSPEKLNPKGYDSEITQLVSLIDSAKKEVLIQVLEYSPEIFFGPKGYWAELDNAIRSAAVRGVQVNMIVSNWALRKPEINYVKSLSLVPNVHVKFSALPEYQHKFMSYSRVEHCKYMVVDQHLSWVGTGNWQWGYFYNTRDIAIIIDGLNPAKQLRQIFYRDWFGPYVQLIDPDKNYTPPKTH